MATTYEENKTEPVPFGKHKGKPLSNAIADRKYIQWVVKQPWYRFAIAIHKQLEKAK